MYYQQNRPEFKAYIDAFFRTLHHWMEDDAKKSVGKRFFG